MNRLVTAIALGTSLFVAGTANAQLNQAGASIVAVGTYGGGFGSNYGFGNNYFSSTAAEGYLRGSADYVRALGDNAYMNSLAAINAEQARSQYIDNRSAWTRTYFDMRSVNREYRVAERGRAPTLDEAKYIAKAAAPTRLNAYQLQRTTGAINWPAALQGEQFIAARQQLEQAFADRDVHNSGVGSTTFSAISSAASVMRDQLKNQVTYMNPAEYVAAKKFVDGLAYEARFALGVEGFASK